MEFPQYLWRVHCRFDLALMLRRGNTPDEVIEKCMRKDVPESHFPHRVLPIGIASYCELEDKEQYSVSHSWDWLNS